MTRCTCCLVVVTASVATAWAEPPPLTDDQKARISKLANETKQESERLKALLDLRQKDLAAVYSEYQLDEDRATKLEAEVLDLQRQMLANYRKMQVELRTLVGEERFNLLRRRLDNMLKTPPKEVNEKGR
ncbi:MAG TPA: hypothetical protein VKD71_03480 [Gemmataceae bacterium]|nr:hypothetical protein [Gemmataceae bacterium]